jgi:hypothetical protein
LLAGPASGNAVIELYHGSRPREADVVMPKLREALHSFHTEMGPDALLHLRRLPAVLDKNITSTMVADDMELGYKLWIRGNPDAAKMLASAEKYASDNGPATVQIADLQERRVKALVAYALTLKAKGDDDGANSVMQGLMRTYPDVVIKSGKFSSDAEALFLKNLRIMESQQPGTLVIVGDNLDVYVNEVFRGRAGRLDVVAAPGTYRVLVRDGQTWWRFDVDVPAGRAIGLVVDAKLHRELEWTSNTFGFEFSRADPARDLEQLGLVSKLLQQTQTGVVGMERRKDHLYLTATIYDANENALGAKLETELGHDDDDARIQAIAAYLASGTRSPYLEDNATEHRVSVVTGSTSDGVFWPAYVGVGAYLGFTVLSGYFFHEYSVPNEGNCFSHCIVAGSTSTALSLAAGAFAITWLIKQIDVPTKAAAIVPVPGGAMVSAGWSF